MRATTRPDTRHPAAAPLALPRTTPPRLPRALALFLLLALTLLAPLAHAQTTYSWTGTIDANWSTAGNWNPIGVPANGDSLVFPAGAANLTNNNDLPVGRSLAQVTFTGSNYTLNGNGITLTSTLRSEASTSNNTVNLPIDVGTNAVTLAGGNAGFLRLAGALSGSGPITLSATSNCGRLALVGTHGYSGTLTINNTSCPTIALNGASFPSATLIHGGNVLSGNGTVGPLTWNTGGDFLVSGNDVVFNSDTTTGQLNTGNLVFSNSGSLFMDINGTTPGASYDQINVTGTVALGSSKALNLRLASSFVPSLGQQFVLINNDGVDAISGTFNGRAEGSIVALNGAEFQLSYVGGSGSNDVVLTCTFSPKAWNGSASNLWSNPNNWTPTGVPVAGEGLLFPSGAANLSNTNDLAPGSAFSRIIFTGSGYTLGGNGITLTSTLRSEASTSNNTVNLPIDVGTNAVTLAGGNAGFLRLAGALSGSGPITLSATSNCGRLALVGTHGYSGTLTINNTSCPTIALNGASFPSATLIHGGNVLSGNGTVGPLTWNTGGDFLVSGNDVVFNSDTTTGQLNTGNLVFSNSGSLFMDINGTTPGASYDQINVTGTVALGSSKALNLRLASSFVPSLGQQFVLINNDGVDAISGTFNGRAEGSIVALNGAEFQLSYVGGSGSNDVVLTCTFSPKPGTARPAIFGPTRTTGRQQACRWQEKGFCFLLALPICRTPTIWHQARLSPASSSPAAATPWAATASR